MKLGEILVRRGAVTRPQVDEALRKKEGQERIGQTLIRLGMAGEEDVLLALSEQTHLPYVDLTGVEIDPSLLDPVAVKTVFRRRALPIDRQNGVMRVAISDPLDLEVLDELKEGLALKSVARVLKLYATALAGREVVIRSAADVDMTEAQNLDNIVLPAEMRYFDEDEKNFVAYKVAAAQGAGRIEFGTYTLSLDNIGDTVKELQDQYGEAA